MVAEKCQGSGQRETKQNRQGTQVEVAVDKVNGQRHPHTQAAEVLRGWGAALEASRG